MIYVISGVLGICLAFGATTAVVHQADQTQTPRAGLYNYGTR